MQQKLAEEEGNMTAGRRCDADESLIRQWILFFARETAFCMGTLLYSDISVGCTRRFVVLFGLLYLGVHRLYVVMPRKRYSTYFELLSKQIFPDTVSVESGFAVAVEHSLR